MTKYYDASQEFKPFANRGAGGQLLQEPTFKGHPNKQNYRKWAGKANASLHRPNRRIRVCVHSGSPYLGYSHVKV